MAGGIRALVEGCKPCAAMVATQCIYAAIALWVKAAFSRGMSPFVFVVYRQGFATLALAPIAVMAKRTKLKEMSLGLGVKGFSMVFVAALIGATANQYFCYHGLHLGSPSLSMTLTNLVPAITFVMAAAVGVLITVCAFDLDIITGSPNWKGKIAGIQERVNIGELSSLAKILGTVVCVGGAATMAFFKGPKLLNYSGSASTSVLVHPSRRNWAMGALLQFASCSCWSIWLIMQKPICKLYADPLTLSAWTCLFSTLQSAVVAVFLLPDLSAWKIHTLFELSSCIFAGVFGSGVSFFLQAWCISVRGPLYSAVFMPLCAVITTALSTIVLHEVLHAGSLVGVFAIIFGLYIVLWGKAKEAERGMESAPSKDLVNTTASSDSQPDTENTLTGPREIVTQQIERK